MTEEQKKKIRELLETKIKEKLEKFGEVSYIPFLEKLIQSRESVIMYSFIHSLATMLGMAIYEEIAKIIAEPLSERVDIRKPVKGFLSDEQIKIIEDIINDLKLGNRKPDKEKEIHQVLQACKGKEEGREYKAIVDFFMIRNSKKYYFEIKTSKPNKDVFVESKRKLLYWVAMEQEHISTYLAFPYNPYYPKDYKHFPIKGIIDERKELLIGEDFWDFIGGSGTYREIIQIFDEVGKSIKPQISQKINEIISKR